MQDFRTLIVCPNCGESSRSTLIGPVVPALSLEKECVLRRCLACLSLWWVDWSPAPDWAPQPAALEWEEEDDVGEAESEVAVLTTPTWTLASEMHRARRTRKALVRRPSGF
jgi:hypothetical protein